MIISTKKGAPQAELDRIIDNFEHQGLSVTLIRGTDYNVFGLVGDTTKIAEKDVLANPWVENVTRVSAPYKRANRLFHPDDTVVDVNGIKIGGKSPIAVMAGPCSVEGEEHTLKISQSTMPSPVNCAVNNNSKQKPGQLLSAAQFIFFFAGTTGKLQAEKFFIR